MKEKKTSFARAQRLFARVLSLLLLFSLVIAVLEPQQAQAVDVNGEAGTGIPGASSVSGGYRIRRTGVPIAFRFTVVTEAGDQIGAPKDIYAEEALAELQESYDRLRRRH